MRQLTAVLGVVAIVACAAGPAQAQSYTLPYFPIDSGFFTYNLFNSPLENPLPHSRRIGRTRMLPCGERFGRIRAAGRSWRRLPSTWNSGSTITTTSGVRAAMAQAADGWLWEQRAPA